MRTGDAIDPFLRQMTASGRLTRATARNYGPALRLFASVLGDRRLREATHEDVEVWLAEQEHLTAATRRQRIAQLSRFCAWARRYGHMTVDVMADTPRPRSTRRVPRALPQSSAQALMAAAPNPRGRAVLGLMLYMGLRCCEVAGLDLADWDNERGTLTVAGKYGDERTLPVPTRCAVHLEEYLIERGRWPGPFIQGERWKRGQRISPDQLSKLVSAWCWRAGIKRHQRDGVSAHAARHTAASDVFERCDSATGLLVVKAMLGHRFVSTTAQYLREARMSDLRDAMEGRDYRPGSDGPLTATGTGG